MIIYSICLGLFFSFHSNYQLVMLSLTSGTCRSHENEFQYFCYPLLEIPDLSWEDLCLLYLISININSNKQNSRQTKIQNLKNGSIYIHIVLQKYLHKCSNILYFVSIFFTDIHKPGNYLSVPNPNEIKKNKSFPAIKEIIVQEGNRYVYIVYISIYIFINSICHVYIQSMSVTFLLCS